ncbi:MAG: Gfo/Idh/MocA family oxidoreductase [Chloroflexi bacterium]|nr:Gfo/Idh/MocA family oxidoreductase [Chloroflexota bacterium]
MSEKKVRIGIVGIGNMGSKHVKHVIDLPNTTLASVCDRDLQRVETAFAAVDPSANGESSEDAAEAGDADAITDENAEKAMVGQGEDDDPDYARIVADAPQFTEFEEMLDRVELDAVIIATPHYDHPDMSLMAFERGIHVLVEKPIAVHVKEAQRMIDGYSAAKKENPSLVFAAMFMQRAWGHWRKIKSMIEGGKLGRLIRCSWLITDWFRTQSYYDSGGWRATWRGEGGGVLMNQCPHNLDLYQWFVGMPARAQGFVSFGKHHRIEVEDEVTAYFEHENGMVGHFVTTTGESPGTNRLEIAGENGKLVYQDDEILLFRNEWSSIKQIREAENGFEAVPNTREKIAYAPNTSHGHEHIIENFADAILNGAALIAPAEEGLNSVAINNAIILSAHKRQMVDLPFDGDEFVALLERYILQPPA